MRMTRLWCIFLLATRRKENPVTDGDSLNDLEQMVLLALARLGPDGYGVTIREEIERRAGRPVSIAAVYAALDRMERRRLVRSWLSDPTPERGGRAKKHFRIEPAGVALLHEARAAMERMWEGLDLRYGPKRP